MSDSTSNPNVIQLEDWCRDEPDQQLGSDADTEGMTTPEFWGSLAGGNFPYPEKDEAAIASSSIHVPASLLDCEYLEGFQSLEQLQPDPGALKATEKSFDDPFGAARIKSAASDHEGTLS
ncbi:hypothetical protein N7468_000845 [Penicillium chermesinum]|uniref:Uncharacterized protein n=1 Tax=Penicillium chermesinum TaxID=63820 RepID=A0A9W9PIH4_9EURO|nr:uncharacterized protein N7468_000845 [Penicillium chermesinum]KAJ5245862.1 hypothetical protein N7468_000845 [Penicillium chermesinum]KAJ6144159.1 hypothetical protein N7470_008054 [Penicillium chermesinum]